MTGDPRPRLTGAARKDFGAVVRLFLVMTAFGLVLMVNMSPSGTASRILIAGEVAIIAAFFIGRALKDADND